MVWPPSKRRVLWVIGIVIVLLMLVSIGVWLRGVLAGVLAVSLAVVGVLFWWSWDVLVSWWSWDVLTGKRARITALLLAIGLVVIGVLFWWLWEVFYGFIQPKTPTDRKDQLSVFVLMAAGVVGFLTALAALGNLVISRRNLEHAQATLQQQRKLDDRRAQDDALQSYFEQVGDLLTTHKLMETKRDDDPLRLRLLARAQTLTVLDRFDRWRKRHLLLYLYGAGLINKDDAIVDLANANLREAYLSAANLSPASLSRADLRRANLEHASFVGAYLNRANFSEATLSNTDFNRANLSAANLGAADLSNANLSNADLRSANLSGADLSGASLRSASLRSAFLFGAELVGTDLSDANLSNAYLSDAVLSGATVTEEQLSSCESLQGATMPNGQKYEEWIKDKEGRSKDADNADSS
jgi:uncharacterized protein YjbI with pentapeptide repeats